MSKEMEEVKLKGEEVKAGGEEGKKKLGRPKKVEELAKMRRGSDGSLDEYIKRKRDGVGENKVENEEWLLRRSKNIERLQEVGTGGGRREGYRYKYVDNGYGGENSGKA